MKWKYPNWNEADFKINIDNYRQTRPIEISQVEKRTGITEPIFYEIKLYGKLCARLSPKEYYNIRADMAITEALKIEDLESRIIQLRKVKSDIEVHALYDLEYSGEIYKKAFDISAILKKLDVRINNTDAAINSQKTTKKAKKPVEEITHRVHVLIQKYLEKAKIADPIGRKEYMETGGAKRYQAFLSLNPQKKKPATIQELQAAYKLLSKYPHVQKAVKNDIEELKKS